MILVYPCVNLFFYARKINSQMKDLLKIKHPNTAFNQVRAHRSHLGTIQHNTAQYSDHSILNSLLNASAD